MTFLCHVLGVGSDADFSKSIENLQPQESELLRRLLKLCGGAG